MKKVVRRDSIKTSAKIILATSSFDVISLASGQINAAYYSDYYYDTYYYAKNPSTGNWDVFPSQNDVPAGWEISVSKPLDFQSYNVLYAKNPTTGNWLVFPTQNDVPASWEISSVSQPFDFQSYCEPQVAEDFDQNDKIGIEDCVGILKKLTNIGDK